MKIHVIQTGTVAVKSRQPRGVGTGNRRVLNTLLDTVWSEPLPIFAYAIEHPEGVIVVDTGETSRTAERGYLPAWHPYLRYSVRVWVSPEEEMGPQLTRLGTAPRDVRWVVMTHLHTDHAGGLRHFPHSEVLISRLEMKAASGLQGRVRSYLNNHFPRWLDPTIIDLDTARYGPFPQSMPLTRAEDVVLLPVPGHTPGMMVALVEEGDRRVLLAGDASYTQQLMLERAVDGVGPDEAAQRLAHERIRALAAEAPTVYAVAHDPNTRRRVESREPVPARPPQPGVPISGR